MIAFRGIVQKHHRQKNDVKSAVDVHQRRTYEIARLFRQKDGAYRRQQDGADGGEGQILSFSDIGDPSGRHQSQGIEQSHAAVDIIGLLRMECCQYAVDHPGNQTHQGDGSDQDRNGAIFFEVARRIGERIFQDPILWSLDGKIQDKRHA